MASTTSKRISRLVIERVGKAIIETAATLEAIVGVRIELGRESVRLEIIPKAGLPVRNPTEPVRGRRRLIISERIALVGVLYLFLFECLLGLAELGLDLERIVRHQRRIVRVDRVAEHGQRVRHLALVLLDLRDHRLDLANLQLGVLQLRREPIDVLGARVVLSLQRLLLVLELLQLGTARIQLTFLILQCIFLLLALFANLVDLKVRK